MHTLHSAVSCNTVAALARQLAHQRQGFVPALPRDASLSTSRRNRAQRTELRSAHSLPATSPRCLSLTCFAAARSHIRLQCCRTTRWSALRVSTLAACAKRCEWYRSSSAHAANFALWLLLTLHWPPAGKQAALQHTSRQMMNRSAAALRRVLKRTAACSHMCAVACSPVLLEAHRVCASHGAHP